MSCFSAVDYKRGHRLLRYLKGQV
ncbi:TPA: hypothetical protein N0F65_010963 [Lagenidium giganteum]|uniref:Uncharacterized protein n=1 Tax=Lagenidium giganteum TaxID=4803 RepID=A0AAV2Z857_9STRA|nr:TPA: hypothetical protein N0F65_010963 [Lagenidium giganteum]